jgi:hypothetical protein
MEGLIALERKNLADLVDCTVTSRERFLTCCSRLAKFRWRAAGAKRIRSNSD